MRQAFAVFVCLGLASVIGCGGPSAEPKTTASAPATVPATTLAAQVKPYVYPAPVEGHFEDANYGNFDLRDGIAYASSTSGTVVLATEKAIASPILASSTCPMTQARALLLIRNSGALE